MIYCCQFTNTQLYGTKPIEEENFMKNIDQQFQKNGNFSLTLLIATDVIERLNTSFNDKLRKITSIAGNGSSSNCKDISQKTFSYKITKLRRCLL
jgi:uncharacterized membrane protein